MTQRKTSETYGATGAADVSQQALDVRAQEARLEHYARAVVSEAATTPFVGRTPLDSATLVSEMHEHTNRLRVWAYKAIGLRQ